MKTEVLIVNRVTLLAVLTFLSIIVFRFIRDGLKHRRIMKNLKKWSVYHKQLTDWASEIQPRGL